MVDFSLRYAALCRCSMVHCVLMGYRCGLCWGAIRGGRLKLVNVAVFVHALFGQRTFTRGLQVTSSWDPATVGSWSGSSAFVMDGGFLCPFPDWVDDFCVCMLLLSHCCLCYLVMLVCRRPGRDISTGLLCLLPCWVVAAVPGGVEIRGSLVFSRHGWLLPPSRAGKKYGAVVRWFARQRQPSS